MHPEMYAVVDGRSETFKFTKWHDSLDEAKAEAERLAKKEGATFYVLKVIGYAEITKVNWVEL